MDARTHDERASTDRFIFRSLLPARHDWIADELADAAVDFGGHLTSTAGEMDFATVYDAMFGKDGMSLLVDTVGDDILDATPKQLHQIAIHWADSVRQHRALMCAEAEEETV